MSTFRRSCLVLIIASLVVSMVYLTSQNDNIESVESSNDPETQVSSDLVEESDTNEVITPVEKAVAGGAADEPHAADCSHCAEQQKPAAEPQLLTNPSVDKVFKELARMDSRYIPADTFDFLEGSQTGEKVSFKIGELDFQGEVSVVRENHPMARTYGINLKDDFGRVVVKTDAVGAMRAHLFFMEDSRVIQTLSGKAEGEGEVLNVEETTVSSVVCAPPGTIFTKTGFRSVSGTGSLKETTSQRSTTSNVSELNIPLLESNPGAEYVMFLDFDGALITDTDWNSFVGPIDAGPIANAADAEWVTLVWRRSVEDMAPFAINVTTNEAVFNDPDQDVTKRLHVVITDNDAAAPGAGGVAFLHSFREDTPVVWVYNDSEYSCAETITHEAGHAFGLNHDSLVGRTPPFDYYPGHNGSYDLGWAPIMGASFLDGLYDEVTQWSIGEYPDANNTNLDYLEDDLVVIGDKTDPQEGDPSSGASNGFGFIVDDYADSYDQSGLGGFEIIGERQIQSTGIISTRDDVDVFPFSAPEGALRFTISPLDVNSVYSRAGSNTAGANLAVNAQLLDASGAVIAEGLPAGGNLLSSLIEASVSQGTYYIAVDGGGRGTDPETGFSDYASLGQYTVVGELALPPLFVSGGPKQTVTIFNGATSVDLSNGTDYGFSTPGSSQTNTFFLENSGELIGITNLNVSLAGGSGSQFNLKNVSFNSLQPDEGNFIEITYSPSSTGTHSDTVIISYEAGEPQVFEFEIRGSATTSLTKDNYEDNNSALDSYSLGVYEDTWLEDIEGLAFFLSDQNDWYTFTAEETDDLIRIDIALEPDAQNVRFELVNFNYNVVASSTGSTIQYLIPETYTGSKRKFYIHATSLDDTSVRNAYDLRWSAIELTGAGDDLYEENDTRGTAFDLTGFGTQLSQILGLGNSSDEDWYKLDVELSPFTRMLYVAALFDHAQGNIDIEVYRESSLLGSSATAADKEMVNVYEQLDFDDFPQPFTYTPSGNFLVMGVQPGTYYIRVYGDFAGNNYDLIVEERRDDRYEVIDEAGTENDSQANAYPLGEEIVGKYLSEIDGVGTSAFYPEGSTEENFVNGIDNDWYAFTIGGTDPIEELIVDFESFNGGTADFYLYDLAGDLLATSSNDSTSLGTLRAFAPIGREFYIRAVAGSSSDALSGYDFKVTFSAEPPFIDSPEEDNYEENDTFAQLFNISNNEGRYLSSVDGYGTQLDPDWFEIFIPSNASKLSVSLVFINADGNLDLTLSRKNGPVHFTSTGDTNTESIVWENPNSGAHALTVTGENKGNFYNLLWDITLSEDNYEENDLQGQAFDIISFENRLLNKLDGIAIQADDDWYKIAADADTVELRAAIAFSHSEGDIDMALYNASGGLVRRAISTDDNESLVYNNPVAGDYYLRVYFADEGNEYDLTWSALSQAELDAIPEIDDNYEENDSANTAYLLAETEQRLSETLGLGIQKDEDWYEFVVPNNNVGLRLECLFEDNLGDIDIELYDPLGFPLAVRDSIDDNELLLLDSPVPTGVYQLRVYGPNLGTEYDLYYNPYIEDIYEENDVAAEAYDISLLLGSPLSDEGIPTLGDDDWYRFNVSSVLPFVSVELDYQQLNGAIDFELLDSSLNVVATANSTDDFDSVILPATNGTYYVRVFGENAYNPYDLTVSVLGDDEYEENDIAAEAYDITALPSIQAAQFDEDWFFFEVTDANNFLSIFAAFTHQRGNVDLYLYNSTDLNTPIGSGTSSDDNESFRVPGVAGIYYLQVVGDGSNPAYQLSWTVSPDDEFEQNDILEEATNITDSEGVAINALQFDPDWYELAAGPGKLKIVVDLLFVDAEGDLNLTLYDSAGEELLFVNSDTDNEQISYSLFPFGTAAETYYIKVDGTSAGTAYDLIWQTSIEDNFEGDTGNNTYLDASDDLLAAEGQKISDTIGYGGALNDDWYKVQINPGDTGIVIETYFQHSAENNIDLELFNEGQIFLRHSIGFSNVERINFEGAPGIYYLRVFGTSSDQPYDLVWNSYTEDNLEPGFSLRVPKDPPDNDTPDFPRGLQFLLANFSARGSSNLEFVKLDNLTQLDEDWYIFEVFEGEDIFLLELEFEHRFGDVDVAVYQIEYDIGGTVAGANLITQEESVTDGEDFAQTDLPAGEYLICVYGYGIYNPKSETGWTPNSFDPYTEDYSVIEENVEPGENSYYELDEKVARGLGNTYTMRWISTTDDVYDVETANTGDIEINDSFGTAAEPELVDQFDNVVPGGFVDDKVRTHNTTNASGENITIEYRPTYTYYGLSQLDEDWYKFTVDTGGVHDFYAGISFSDFQANLDLFLYDDSNNLLASSESEGSSFEFIEIQGSGQQTYYLKVVGEDLGTPYTLFVRGFFDDIYEENDDISQADENANITVLTSESVFEPLLTDLVQRDKDLYRVDIPNDQVHMAFNIDPFGEGLNVRVLDEEGNLLPSGYRVSGNTDDNFYYRYGVISPGAGVYYLEVTGSNSGASYELGWNYDNQDEYEGFQFDAETFEIFYSNDQPEYAENLSRLRLEPVFDEKIPYTDPIQELAFDYSLLSNLRFADGFLVDPFGHAIQEADDWYSIQIPSWMLASAKKGDKGITVLKRQYFIRLSAEIEFVHLDGNINLEIYDETDLVTPLGRSATSEDIESLTVAVDPTQEALTYYLRVYGDDAANDYSLKWDVSAEDAYEQLEDADPENDTNNFVDMAYDLTNADGDSTEATWLHEIEYLQDVNGDGVVNTSDGGLKSTTGYGMQRTDDWYAVVVSEGATQLEVKTRFYSDNDTGYEYAPDDLDMDFEVYFLAGDDGDPVTRDLRKPVLIGRSILDTDDTLFSDAGDEAKALLEDITVEISEDGVFDVDQAGIYLIRVYYDNRSHPYTLYWDDIGDADNTGDAAIIDEYVNGYWGYDLPPSLASSGLRDPYGNLDGDRFVNWAEFALGLNPASPDYDIIGQSIVEVDGLHYYQFEFIRSIEAKALEYEYIVQESADLNFGDAQAVYIGEEPIAGSPDLERVTYHSTLPIEVREKCFFRLIVNEPPDGK